jgi:hypothetical protein
MFVSKYCHAPVGSIETNTIIILEFNYIVNNWWLTSGCFSSNQAGQVFDQGEKKGAR